MARRKEIGAAKGGAEDPLYDRLASMNLSELQEEARRVGVPSPSELRKEELIDAIKRRS